MSDLRDLYEEVILEHNRRPRNYPKSPEGANRHAHGFNPLCGDEFTIHMRVNGDRIVDVGFEGAGCAISTASASLMTEALKGKTIEEAEALFRNVHNLLTQEGAHGEVGKLEVLAGIHDFPMRVKCATLAWHTMHCALEGKEETVTTE